MKKITLMIIGLSIVPVLSGANATIKSYGSTHYEKQTLSNVEVSGSATFQGTKATGTTKINGPLSAKNSTFERLEINGQCKVKDCHIQEALINGAARFDKVNLTHKVEINGPLTAEDSQFKGLLSVAAPKIILEDSHVKDIEIRDQGGSEPRKKEQVIILKNTTVEGDIKFAKGNNKVIALHGSKVKGKIERGQLIEK